MGGAGNDMLAGGAGSDNLNCGAGKDTANADRLDKRQPLVRAGEGPAAHDRASAAAPTASASASTATSGGRGPVRGHDHPEREGDVRGAGRRYVAQGLPS